MSLPRPIASILLLAACVAASPATAPTSDGDRPGQRLERLLALDDLTPDQRAQIAAIGVDVRAEIARSRSATAPVDRAALRDIMDRARNRAIAVLTPSQRDRLRTMRVDAADPGPPIQPTAAVIPEPASRPTSHPSFGVGDRLPTFSISRVDGKPITFESLVGRPTVLVFGSYSSPAFRDELPRIADLAARYGSRVNVVVIYTREMFPSTQAVDQPERNQDAKIAVAAATTDADRKATAKLLIDKLKLKLPVGVDPIDDRLATALEGFPNAAIVADAKGVVVARWNWAEPFAIKRALDTLLATK